VACDSGDSAYSSSGGFTFEEYTSVARDSEDSGGDVRDVSTSDRGAGLKGGEMGLLRPSCGTRSQAVSGRWYTSGARDCADSVDKVLT
jgi:hypothetical protein